MDQKSLLQWLANPVNGLVKSQKVNGVVLEVKFLPPEYLAAKDLQDEQIPIREYNELLREYSEGMAFIITVRPEGNGQATLFNNVTTLEEFRNRVYDLNFSFGSKIRLHNDVGTFEPVLAVMENTYVLQEHKNFYVLFANTDPKLCLTDTREIDIVFNDDVFATGVTHFRFLKDDMQRVPTLSPVGL